MKDNTNKENCVRYCTIVDSIRFDMDVIGEYLESLEETAKRARAGEIVPTVFDVSDAFTVSRYLEDVCNLINDIIEA